MSQRLPSTDRSLTIALLRARERVMGPMRQIISEVGLTEQQWRVLRVVREMEEVDPTQIADRACLLLPSLTRILQKLEEKALIQRTKDTSDRRRQVITLTDDGRQIIEENIAATLEVLDRPRAQMGSERYEALLDLLNELNELEL